MADDLDKLVRRYNRSAKAVSQEAALKREITTVKQSLDRAARLYDSLYQNYADKLMTEREYTEMKQLVSNIKVISKDTLMVCFKDGTEIMQTIGG